MKEDDISSDNHAEDYSTDLHKKFKTTFIDFVETISKTKAKKSCQVFWTISKFKKFLKFESEIPSNISPVDQNNSKTSKEQGHTKKANLCHVKSNTGHFGKGNFYDKNMNLSELQEDNCSRSCATESPFYKGKNYKSDLGSVVLLIHRHKDCILP